MQIKVLMTRPVQYVAAACAVVLGGGVLYKHFRRKRK